MIPKEIIPSEMETFSIELLEELYRLVKAYSETQSSPPKRSFMARLREIHINGPEDFAANIDLYLSGEKTVD